VNAAMILLGWLMELLHPPDRARTRWLPFVLGCVVGAVAWIAIALQIGISAGRGHTPPTFVYAIFVSLFVLFNSFAVNQALQYERFGRWRDYRYGERWYLRLSLVAKSLLAWQSSRTCSCSYEPAARWRLRHGSRHTRQSCQRDRSRRCDDRVRGD